MKKQGGLAPGKEKRKVPFHHLICLIFYSTTIMRKAGLNSIELLRETEERKNCRDRGSFITVFAEGEGRKPKILLEVENQGD